MNISKKQLWLVIATVIIIIMTVGSVTFIETRKSNTSVEAMHDADKAADASEKAAISARKAADATQSTADSAKVSAKEATTAAKDASEVTIRKPPTK